jgi:hypothetical protein
MSEKPTESARALTQAASPYGYPFWEWVAREDPEYVKARKPITDLSVGEGKALPIKYREMVIIAVLAFRESSEDGIVAHMRRDRARRHEARAAGGHPVGGGARGRALLRCGRSRADAAGQRGSVQPVERPPGPIVSLPTPSERRADTVAASLCRGSSAQVSGQL